VNTDAPDALLARVRKLLVKAEATGVTAEEAQALTAKAAELMAKYGIDRALLAAERPETDRPADRFIDIANPWARVQAHLLCGLASALRCQCVILPRSGPGTRIHMFGYTSDIERADVLYTSVLIQMWQGLAATPLPGRVQSARAWRRSWLLGFVTAVVARVRAAEDNAARQAAGPAAGAASRTALVLADRTRGHHAHAEARVPGDPHLARDLHRQRLRDRLLAGSAGRHRRVPAAHQARPFPHRWALSGSGRIRAVAAAGRGRSHRCRAGAARTARTPRRERGTRGRVPRRAGRARRAR
jgi:hypothetical protein